MQIAEEIFDHPIFLDYEVPYYKVRVGSFRDKESAEVYQLRAKSAGYNNAWVVMVTVNINKAENLYEDILLLNDDTVNVIEED